MSEPIQDLQDSLAASGSRCAVVSVSRMPDLRRDLQTLLDQGLLASDFYDEIVSRYGLHWDFTPSATPGGTRSVIVTAAPQPKIRTVFRLAGRVYPVIIPPTYIHDSDVTVSTILSRSLGERGYGLNPAVLPEKALAIHSGLAAYGRNNIAYVGGFGSYCRLRVFFSDLPCHDDSWQRLAIMEACEKCTACVRKCPTGAILEDRFLIDASRCLTYLNEGPGRFPRWVDSAWHSCMVGCMVCQDVCPANRDQTGWITEGREFSEKETSTVLDATSLEGLPLETVEKLKGLPMLDDFRAFRRNLSVLLRR